MMKLSAMVLVDGAVDSQGRFRIAESILERWEHDPEPAQFYRSSANFVYVFRKGGERFFLRFAASAERSEAEIAAEMTLLDWLARQGLTVTTPIPSNNGRRVETVETELGTFHAVVFAELHGVEREIVALSAVQFEQWGAALGNLHATMRRYQDPTAHARRSWIDRLTLALRSAPQDEPMVQAESAYLMAWLSALPVTATNYGLIHGDFELDNLFWQDDTVAMLDFDDCSYCWYDADVAFALRDLFEDGVDLSSPSLRAFIRGYTQHAVLDEEAISRLPTWMRLANLIVYAKLMRSMDLAVDQDGPEWAAPLQVSLRRWVENYTVSLRSISR